MKRATSSPVRAQRGSVLLVALLLAIALALGLTGYLVLARNALVAQRTFNVRDALGLAEAGLEEALDSFRQMDAGATTAAAWTGWTLSGGNATRTLTPFDRDRRAIATVKIFVQGYDGSANAPLAISQATLVPFDGTAPFVQTVRIALVKQAYFTRGIVARQGLSWSGQPSADSYNSNPSGSPTGPWAAYPGTGAGSNTLVVVATGTISLGAQSMIYGNLSLGASVSPPPANKVAGTISNTFNGSFAMPVYPTAASVSVSYDLGSTMPATLPVSGHLPAADGRYYYFCRNTTIRNVTVSSGRSVTIVGTTTGMGAGIVVQSSATLQAYMDGVVAGATMRSRTATGPEPCKFSRRRAAPAPWEATGSFTPASTRPTPRSPAAVAATPACWSARLPRERFQRAVTWIFITTKRFDFPRSARRGRSPAGLTTAPPRTERPWRR